MMMEVVAAAAAVAEEEEAAVVEAELPYSYEVAFVGAYSEADLVVALRLAAPFVGVLAVLAYFADVDIEEIVAAVVVVVVVDIVVVVGYSCLSCVLFLRQICLCRREIVCIFQRMLRFFY